MCVHALHVGDGTAQSWFFGESQDGRQGSFPGTFVRKIAMVPKKINVSEDGDVTVEPADQPSKPATVEPVKTVTQLPATTAAQVLLDFPFASYSFVNC